MLVVLGVLVTAMGSLALVVNGLRRAPEAYEDEEGFHVMRKGVPASGISHHKGRREKHELGSLKEKEIHP
jgi:hypothetical protein